MAYQCKPPPDGCGKVIGSFLTEVALDQFKVTGLCEQCQLDLARPKQKPTPQASPVIELDDAAPKATDE